MANLYQLKFEDDNRNGRDNECEHSDSSHKNMNNDYRMSFKEAFLIPISFLVVFYGYILAAIPSNTDKEITFQDDLKKEISLKLDGESLANQVLIAKSYIDNVNNSIIGIHLEVDGMPISIGEVVNKSKVVWFSSDYDKDRFYELSQGLLFIIAMLIVPYFTVVVPKLKSIPLVKDCGQGNTD